MSKKIRWITETAVMLALLICLQWVGSFIPDQMTKQLITGTMVNCVLAVTVLMVGLGSGITVSLISLVFCVPHTQKIRRQKPCVLLPLLPRIVGVHRAKSDQRGQHDRKSTSQKPQGAGGIHVGKIGFYTFHHR